MFFIVGRGRSGTTLLKSILDAHPSISVTPEGLFVMNLYRTYRRGAWTPERIERFARHLFLERRLRRWQVNRDDLERRWREMTDQPTFARLCAEVYDAHADATHKQPGRLLGDKNAHYALFVDALRATFPRAKFVHIVRDYRDNVLSYRNVPFDVKSPAALAYRWVHYNNAVLQSFRRTPGEVHRLRFEDLVTAPEQTIESLCRFLGVEANPAMLSGKDGGGYNNEWHRHLGKPIDPQLAGQWRGSLSPDEVATLDRICQPFAKELGYAPAEPTAGNSRLPAGVALGWSITALERLMFRLPVSLQGLLITTYRRLTGTI